MLRPREVGAAEFKATCLELMDQVQRLGIEIIVTKHRRPVARLVPIAERSSGFCGALSGMILQQRDLVQPAGDTWEADEPNLT